MKGDEDTDLYSAAIAQKDMQGALNEKGEAIEDGFVVVEAPGLASLTNRIEKVYDALVPVCKRHEIETAIADSVGKGLDAVLECCQELEIKYNKAKYHQDWLHAMKEALADDDHAPCVTASTGDQSHSPNRLLLTKKPEI